MLSVQDGQHAVTKPARRDLAFGRGRTRGFADGVCSPLGVAVRLHVGATRTVGPLGARASQLDVSDLAELVSAPPAWLPDCTFEPPGPSLALGVSETHSAVPVPEFGRAFWSPD